MFYLFKNSSLSQLSPVGLEYQAGTRLISGEITLTVLSAERGKLALIKPLIQFLLDIADIVFTKAGRGTERYNTEIQEENCLLTAAQKHSSRSFH